MGDKCGFAKKENMGVEFVQLRHNAAYVCRYEFYWLRAQCLRYYVVPSQKFTKDHYSSRVCVKFMAQNSAQI
jgi:hypothetical protein